MAETITLTINILDGEKSDMVVVTAGDKRIAEDVPRETYVEERWGRHHRAREAVWRIVANGLQRWDFPAEEQP
jgi:hypothetical protein